MDQQTQWGLPGWRKIATAMQNSLPLFITQIDPHWHLQRSCPLSPEMIQELSELDPSRVRNARIPKNSTQARDNSTKAASRHDVLTRGRVKKAPKPRVKKPTLRETVARQQAMIDALLQRDMNAPSSTAPAVLQTEVQDDGEEEEDTDFYEVERIISTRIRRGHREYRVRWKGFTAKDDDWKRRADITKELYQEYIAAHPSEAEDSDDEDSEEEDSGRDELAPSSPPSAQPARAVPSAARGRGGRGRAGPRAGPRATGRGRSRGK